MRGMKLRPDLTRWHLINAACRVAIGYTDSVSKSSAYYALDAIRVLTGKRSRIALKEDGKLCPMQRRGYAEALVLLDKAAQMLEGTCATDDGHTADQALKRLERVARGLT